MTDPTALIESARVQCLQAVELRDSGQAEKAVSVLLALVFVLAMDITERDLEIEIVGSDPTDPPVSLN